MPRALVVIEISGGRISGITSFLDTGRLFPRFGLPLALDRAPVQADQRLVRI